MMTKCTVRSLDTSLVVKSLGAKCVCVVLSRRIVVIDSLQAFAWIICELILKQISQQFSVRVYVSRVYVV